MALRQRIMFRYQMTEECDSRGKYCFGEKNWVTSMSGHSAINLKNFLNFSSVRSSNNVISVNSTNV